MTFDLATLMHSEAMRLLAGIVAVGLLSLANHGYAYYCEQHQHPPAVSG